jgi:hypothetical protein
MKIAIADNQQLKFIGDLKKHWESKGHEVKYEMGASEILFEWADLYFVDGWENNIHYLYNWYKEHPEAKKPKVACRAIDWEVWQGLARDQDIIDWVDYQFAIAPHIARKLQSENRWDRLEVIKCGIDTQKFTFRKDGNSFGYNVLIPCNEIDWHLKNVSEGIKIFAMLCDLKPWGNWKLTIKGKWTGMYGYMKVFHLDLIEKLGIKDRVTIIEEHVPDYNEFLEQFNYCLVPSYKEAYSYVVGECAAKGIRPVINHWLGAEELWNPDWIYQTPNIAINHFNVNFSAKKNREWVIKNSNFKDMAEKYDKILGT